MRSYRSLVGAVLQDDQLFARTVAQNVAFGDSALDFDGVEAAVRLAAVHEEIAALPAGYHSLIGDMGSVLAGGQKQRVILARAVLQTEAAVPRRGDQPSRGRARAPGQRRGASAQVDQTDHRSPAGDHRLDRPRDGDAGRVDRSRVPAAGAAASRVGGGR